MTTGAQAKESDVDDRARIYGTKRLRNDSSKTEIRILTVKSGRSTDALEGSLTAESIIQAKSQRYDALSYTWGDPSETSLLRLNGLFVSIPSNLHEFLLALRSPHRDARVWADAICVNQGDHVEKSTQVQFMKSIYASADNVRIWLGEMPALNGQVWDHTKQVAAMLRSSYWTRIWVIQEIVMAREVVVHLGSIVESFYGLQSSVETLKGTSQEIRSLSSGFDAVSMTMKQYQDGLTLPWLMKTFKRYGSSDLRDQIYGLLGLVNNAHDEMSNTPFAQPGPRDSIIDYSKPVHWLYWQVLLHYNSLYSAEKRSTQHHFFKQVLETFYLDAQAIDDGFEMLPEDHLRDPVPYLLSPEVWQIQPHLGCKNHSHNEECQKADFQSKTIRDKMSGKIHQPNRLRRQQPQFTKISALGVRIKTPFCKLPRSEQTCLYVAEIPFHPVQKDRSVMSCAALLHYTLEEDAASQDMLTICNCGGVELIRGGTNRLKDESYRQLDEILREAARDSGACLGAAPRSYTEEWLRSCHRLAVSRAFVRFLGAGWDEYYGLKWK